MSVLFEALTSPVVHFMNALQEMENENYVKSSQFFVLFLKYTAKKCNNYHQAAGVTFFLFIRGTGYH